MDTNDLVERLRSMTRTEHDDLSVGDEAADMLEKLVAERDAERAIVDRIWDQLGRPSYEDLGGRSIYDLIDGLKDRAEQAERQRDEMRAALGKIANGDGVYGAQAHEYKQIARATLKAQEIDSLGPCTCPQGDGRSFYSPCPQHDAAPHRGDEAGGGGGAGSVQAATRV